MNRSCPAPRLLALAMLTLFAALSQPARADDRWGHEPYGPPSPLDVAVSPADGRIYVADAAGGKVVELAQDFKPTGRVIETPGISGLDVAADGRLAVVTDGLGGALSVITTEGTRVLVGQNADKRADKPPLTDAQGVLWGPDDTLFVFDAGAGRVKVFDGQGARLFDFGDFTWTRQYHSLKQDKPITEEDLRDRLCRPVRGEWLADGRLLVVDSDGPILDPELNRRAGRISIWKVDVANRTAEFEKFLNNEAYPTARLADVAVERSTGRIYVAEADFPLTDHDTIKVFDGPDAEMRYMTNCFPIRFLTHPRGLALARNGSLVIAEADKGLVFEFPRRPFDTPKGVHDPLEWPKVMRVPICERDRVVIEYTTLEPTLSKVEFAPVKGDWYDYPSPPAEEGRSTVEAAAFDAEGRELKPGEAGTFHRVELTGLEPGRRYAYRYLVSEKAYPGPFWSETFLATTQPPPGKTQYLDAEVIVLLFTNVWTPPRDADVRPQPAAPGPMTAEQIAAVKERLTWAQRFYWINSRGRFNVRYRLVVEEEPYENGPVHNYGYWPEDDHRKIDAILAKHGVAHADTAGLVCLYGYRHWDDHKKSWEISGSGGNTWGSCHDGSAINAFSCGGDTAWLFVHEYGHSMSINYLYSGHNFHFNHFHWNYLPTKYGSHYDGMSAMCREFADVAYWANKYGRLVVVDDKDGDGLPDSDPQCNLDEQRFGSDPEKTDTDADGLTDLEELMATQGLARYAGAFGMRQIEPVFEPNPRDPDADADGLADGDDPSPLYPWSPSVRFARIDADGQLGAEEWPQTGFRRNMTDDELRGDVRLAWDFGRLYIGMVQKVNGAQQPARIYMELDANADGFTVGADNLELTFEPQPDGMVEVRTKHNDTVFRTKPVWRDNILPNPRDVQACWTRQGDEFHLEIAIPQTKDAGLDLVRFEPLAFMLQLRPEHAEHELRLFEPQQHFDVRLR
ncbi:MAG: hypothetical protein AB1716_12390 [Planctomycetota bacterium]